MSLRPRLAPIGALALAASALVGAPARALGTPRVDDGRDLIRATSTPSSMNIVDFAPGDRTEWATHVDNVAGEPVTITLSFATEHRTRLTTDAVHGLRVGLATCTQPWTPTTTDGARTFRCDGTTVDLISATPAATFLEQGFQLGFLPTAGTLDVRATAMLPSSADNSFELLDDALVVTVVATVDGALPGQGVGVVTDPDDGGGVAGVGDGRGPGGGSGATGGALPRTGADLAALALVGMGALAAGTSLVVSATRWRRRRTVAS